MPVRLPMPTKLARIPMTTTHITTRFTTPFGGHTVGWTRKTHLQDDCTTSGLQNFPKLIRKYSRQQEWLPSWLADFLEALQSQTLAGVTRLPTGAETGAQQWLHKRSSREPRKRTSMRESMRESERESEREVWEGREDGSHEGVLSSLECAVGNRSLLVVWSYSEEPNSRNSRWQSHPPSVSQSGACYVPSTQYPVHSTQYCICNLSAVQSITPGNPLQLELQGWSLRHRRLCCAGAACRLAVWASLVLWHGQKPQKRSMRWLSCCNWTKGITNCYLWPSRPLWCFLKVVVSYIGPLSVQSLDPFLVFGCTFLFRLEFIVCDLVLASVFSFSAFFCLTVSPDHYLSISHFTQDINKNET